MPIEKNSRLLSFMAFTALLFACSSAGRISSLAYYFKDGNVNRELMVDLPAGFSDEIHSKRENDVYTRTFRYPEGERFFIACKDQSDGEDVQPLNDPDALKTLRDNIGQEGAGLHEDGTHWARHLRDGFMIGYDSVQKEHLLMYDRALHSARIAR